MDIKKIDIEKVAAAIRTERHASKKPNSEPMDMDCLETHSWRILIVPDDAEDAAINAGIAADPDTFEATEADFQTAKRQ